MLGISEHLKQEHVIQIKTNKFTPCSRVAQNIVHVLRDGGEKFRIRREREFPLFPFFGGLGSNDFPRALDSKV